MPKGYRHPILDEKLRSARNRREAAMLSKAPVRVPKLLAADTYSLTLERIVGERLRDVLSPKNAVHFGAALGSMLKILHAADIIHGDLTTSNVLVDENGELVLIDFGLATTSKRREDRAVDLHVLRETLEGSHGAEKEIFWAALATSYAQEDVLRTLRTVESRGRNKAKY